MNFTNLNDNLIEYINNLKSRNDSISLKAVSGLFNSFITALKNYIESSNEQLDWNKVVLKLDYSIDTDKDGNESIFFKEKSSEKTPEEMFIRDIMNKNYLQVFKTISNNASLIKEKDNTRYQASPEILEELKYLPQEKQYDELLKLFNISPVVICPIHDKPAIVVSFKPLIIEKDKKYYQVIIRIYSENSKPSRWKEEVKENFWSIIYNHIANITDEKDSDFFAIENQIPLPKPKLIPIDNSNRLIKVSKTAELQKFGKKPTLKNYSLFDSALEQSDEETRKLLDQNQIYVVGVDNTIAQNKALFAIQKLLDATGYKGNVKGNTLTSDDNSFKFSGYLPKIRFTPGQYLDAFGVGKYKTNRGKNEYFSNERAEAFKALRDLMEKRYFFYYTKRYFKDGKELFDVIKTVRNLIEIREGYEALEKYEKDIIISGEANAAIEEKLTYITVEPCPILVEEINSQFYLKPANFYQEIKLLVGKTSKYVPLFIEYLITKTHKKEYRTKDTDWILELNYETIAYNLRMDKLIESRQSKRVKNELEKCYKIAKQLGYLLDYKTIMGSTMELEQLILNPQKFKRVNEIKEELKHDVEIMT